MSFSVSYNPVTGTVTSLAYKDDPVGMNFQNGHIEAGIVLYTYAFDSEAPAEEQHMAPNGIRRVAKTLSVKIDGDKMEAEYYAGKMNVLVSRSVENDTFVEKYVFLNKSAVDVFTQRGEFGIFFPLCDRYEGADICLSERAHTHLFCGLDNTWLCALRMGTEGKSLGMALTEGSIDAYSVERNLTSNERGDFILHPSPFHLKAGESKVFTFRWFFHDGKEDFIKELSSFPEMLYVDLPTCVCFPGDEIPMRFSRPCDVEYGGKVLAKGVLKYVFRAENVGEVRLTLRYGNRKTFVRLLVSPDIETLADRRLAHIVSEQQYFGEGPLDGAFLIYDNEDKTVYFDNTFSDHNASRERLGMGLLFALWLQTHDSPQRQSAFTRYISFVMRELVDTATGEVFNTVGKDSSFKRLYNAPWVAALFLESYRATKNKEYLEIMFRIMMRYYAEGGTKFYPVGILMVEQVQALRKAGKGDEADALLNSFKAHADNIVANGVHYPKHEVNYEQSIVSPAASYTLQAYLITGEEKYLTAAKQQIEILRRFDGFAPDHHLFNVAIRHWDDLWFGKRRMFGDTLPHYWSILSSIEYLRYAKITGDKTLEKDAEAGAAGCLSLFTPDGKGSCAYVFPYAVNGKRGEFYDPFANDQDFALYYYLKYFKKEK